MAALIPAALAFRPVAYETAATAILVCSVVELPGDLFGREGTFEIKNGSWKTESLLRA